MTLDRDHQQALQAVCRELTTSGAAVSQPSTESWTEMIERIAVTGQINEISESVYEYFLEVLPPKWVHRPYCGFAEGDEPLRLFWKRDRRFFCRQLTVGESYRLCDFSGVARDYRSS